MHPPPPFIRLTLPSSHQCLRSISSRHNSALIFLTSWLHFLLFQGLVVLVNNWFWLSQCADKDNSRAIKVLRLFFLPAPPTLQTGSRHVRTQYCAHKHTYTHRLVCFITSFSPPTIFLSSSCSVHSLSFPLSSLPFVCFFQALPILLTSVVVFPHLTLT